MYSSERRGRRGGFAGRGRWSCVDGGGRGGGIMKAKMLQVSYKRFVGCVGADAA
jgi:hypothetical protein